MFNLRRIAQTATRFPGLVGVSSAPGITRAPGIAFIGSRFISLKPDLEKYKLIKQPPGYVVGTVNEAYVPPEPNFWAGGHHWSYEKIVTTALIPLTASPFIFGVDIPMVDTAFCVTLLLHCQMGIKSCIIDYIPKRVYGVWHKLASRLLTLGTCVALYGIYVLETTQNGIFEFIQRFWSA